MRRSDLFTFIILIIMVAAVLGSIVAAEWVPGLQPIMWAVVLSILAGTALAYSQFPGFAAHITSSIYGLFVVTVIAGTRADIATAGPWRERIFLIVDKTNEWVRQAMANGSSKETLIFVLILGALLWTLGYTAAWYSFRFDQRRIWHVILPAGVTLFANAYQYSGDNSMAPYQVLYLVAALVLLVQSHFADRESEWMRERIRFAPKLRSNFMAVGIIIGIISLIFSWQLTAVAATPATVKMLQKLNTPYNELLARWNRMFSSVNNYNLRDVDRFTRQLPLGGPRNLSPEPVMLVSVAEGRYFWRAQTLDNYDGATWANTVPDTQELEPYDTRIPLPRYDARNNITADFTLFRGTDSLLSASQPILASVATQATVEHMDGNSVELQQLALAVPLLPGNRYATAGSMNAADATQLRIASNDYPAWVTQRYLQIPNALSDKVKTLAQNIVNKDQADTAYDKAAAIERYLRDNIEYDEKLDAPPPGVEASEYILYMTHRAYCHYYATAMVMMLRSLGVPSRMAIGYAQGNIDNEAVANLGAAVPKTNELDKRVNYLVRGTDAHAWVEVFFPEYGWVEFEPTAAQPPLDRNDSRQREDKGTKKEEKGVALPTPTPSPQPNSAATQQPNQAEATATPKPAAPSPQNQGTPPNPSASDVLKNVLNRLWNSFLPYLLLVPLLYVGARFGLRWAEKAGFTGLPIIAQVYGMFSRWMGWMGITTDHTLTPFERAEVFAERAPEVGTSARRITQLYVARRYSRNGLGNADAPNKANPVAPDSDSAEISQIWQRLRQELPRLWLRLRLPNRAGNRPRKP